MSTIIARTRHSVTSWTIGGLGGWDVVAAVFLSALIIGVCVGFIPSSNHHVSAAATAGFLAMVAPVAWRRRSPLAVAAILAVAALLNGLLAGPLVRCGETLPAIFLAAFAVGAKLDRRKSALGFLLCAASVAAEGIYDPRIGARGLVVTVPVMAAFFVVGRLVRARSETAEALRFRSAELRRQREQNARLAVLADREEISANIEQLLHARIGGIAAAAAAGMAGEAAVTREALVGIEQDGRHVLEHMRGILGALSGRPPGEPQPTLARLPNLLASTTTANTRLSVEGDSRTLAAGLELSGYRIVEHLLQALDDSEDANVDVRLKFCPDALELQVSGPARADPRAVMAAAAARASLHSGTVQHRIDGRMCYATVRLPLLSAHA